MMSDVDSDDNTAMIGRLLDATETERISDNIIQNGDPKSPPDDDETDQTGDVDTCQSNDLDVSAKSAENEKGELSQSSALHVNSANGDVAYNLPRDMNGPSPTCSLISAANDLGSIVADGSASAGFDRNVPAISVELQRTEYQDSAVSSESRGMDQTVQSSSATTVLEQLLSESSHLSSPAYRSPNAAVSVNLRFNAGIHPGQLNSPVASGGAGSSATVDVDGRMTTHVRERSSDRQHVVVRSPSDLGQASSVSQHGSVASPVCSANTPHMTQFPAAFANVESPSLSSNVPPHGSCPTPGMESVGSPYTGGYRRLSTGSASHIQQHLVSPELNAADQRMHSPAGYSVDYPSARQGSYAMRPLHDTSYQSSGGPHSVKSSPGAGVGSPGSGCAMMSPTGGYARAQSFGSSTHSPANRPDQSPASAGSGGFGSSSGLATQQGSFNQPNPSPSGNGGAGRGVGGGSGLPSRSPLGGTNVFSPAPSAAMSPSVVVTSAVVTLSTPLQQSNVVAFSCSPPDAGLPFHFPTNVAVPVSATTYANAPSPTPHSLQLLSPSNNNNRQSAIYQAVSTSTNVARRQQPHQQLSSSAVGLPYYGMLPSPPTSMSYAGMINRRFADTPLENLMSSFTASAVPSGRQTAPLSRTVPADCSIVQLQQLTNRLTEQSPQPSADISYGTRHLSRWDCFCQSRTHSVEVLECR